MNSFKSVRSFRFLQLSIGVCFNYYVQLVATKRGRMRVANLKFWSARQKGAGRAQSCTRRLLLTSDRIIMQLRHSNAVTFASHELFPMLHSAKPTAQWPPKPSPRR